MSYPDEHEAQVEAMLAELAAADMVPDSVRMLNDAVIRSLAEHGFPRPVLLERLCDEAA